MSPSRHRPVRATRTRTPYGVVGLAVLAAALSGCGPASLLGVGSSAATPTSRSTAAGTASAGVHGTDPLRGKQWNLRAVRATSAWRTATGAGVVIAVVDTGVDSSHPDLRGRLVAGKDFVDPKTPSGRSVDPNGHGTHVAGIAAAATGNGIGVSGGAPGARIMPVRVLGADGTGSESTIAAGIVWAAEHGAKVINLSLGESGLLGLIFQNGVVNDAVRTADAAGAVVVAAAGNDGMLRMSYLPGTPVLVVNASTSTSGVAAFSNVGDLRAVAAPGQGILSTAPRGRTTLWPKGTDGYATLDGTSMAAPLVSAEAALLVQRGLTPAQVRSRIRSTAVNPGKNPTLGAGIVDFAAAVGTTSSTASQNRTSTRRTTSPPAGAGDGGAGSLTVALTSPVAVRGHVATSVSCSTKRGTYRAGAASTSVTGALGVAVGFAATVPRFHGAGKYPGLVRVDVSAPGAARTVTAPALVTVTAGLAGSVHVSATTSSGETVDATLTWRCSA